MYITLQNQLKSRIKSKSKLDFLQSNIEVFETQYTQKHFTYLLNWNTIHTSVWTEITEVKQLLLINKISNQVVYLWNDLANYNTTAQKIHS